MNLMGINEQLEIIFMNMMGINELLEIIFMNLMGTNKLLEIIFIYYFSLLPDIGLGVRVFANGPGDLGSIPSRVIPKTQKMVLDASLLNIQHYKVRIKGKVEQSREGVAPSPTHWCSSYRKGSLRVTLDYGRQLYFYFSLCKKPSVTNFLASLTLVWLYFITYQPLKVI